MTHTRGGGLCIGDWRVDPAAGELSRGGETVRLEARTLRLLLDLAEHAGEVVSIDDLLVRVWAGVIVTPDSVYQAVASLRRILGDDPRRPRYIATVPRLGYRLMAKVEPWSETERPQSVPPGLGSATALVAAALVVALAAGGLFAVVEFMRTPPATRSVAPVTIGVAPFLDMTVTMDQEALADEMTEGLADRLSRNPSLRSPGFRASIEAKLKGKSKSAAEVARNLGVAYVVDGSVRKDGAKVRVVARLVRADTGFVLWTQTYERPLGDLSVIQSNIADGVADALRHRPRA